MKNSTSLFFIYKVKWWEQSTKLKLCCGGYHLLKAHCICLPHLSPPRWIPVHSLVSFWFTFEVELASWRCERLTVMTRWKYFQRNELITAGISRWDSLKLRSFLRFHLPQNRIATNSHPTLSHRQENCQIDTDHDDPPTDRWNRVVSAKVENEGMEECDYSWRCWPTCFDSFFTSRAATLLGAEYI